MASRTAKRVGTKSRKAQIARQRKYDEQVNNKRHRSRIRRQNRGKVNQ